MDLTRITSRWCATNESFSTQIKDYVVSYGQTVSGPYQYDWSCTCKGFKFRGQCKHVEEAKSQRCAHGHDAVAGSPVEMGETCPSCHGPTTVISVGV